MRGDRRLHLEEEEQVAQVEPLLVDGARSEQEPLDEIAPAGERRREKRERAERDGTRHSARNDDDVRSVIPGGPKKRQRRADEGFTRRELAVLAIPPLGQHAIPLGEPPGETKQLHFLRRVGARTDPTQIVQLTSLGRPSVEQGILHGGEPRFAEEAGDDRDDEQDHEPRTEREQAGAERHERQRVLREAEQLGHEPDSPHGLTPCALQMIVELGILELREIERRGVLHEPHADPIAEPVAEHALDETRRPGQEFTDNDDCHLDRDEAPDRAPRCATPLRGDDAVDDELPDP